MKKANAPAPADVQVLLPAAMMNGKAVVDSREVARMLGRPHKNLLADIHRYISAMERRKADGLNFQPVARDFQLVDFFVPSTYTNDHNQTFPCYLLTQKGCEMVANKLTGEKGILFTAAYVNAFHALQEQAQAGAMVPTVRAAPAALPAAPAAPGIAETRRNNSRLKLAQMWLAMAETAGKAKKAHYRQCAENALLGKA